MAFSVQLEKNIQTIATGTELQDILLPLIQPSCCSSSFPFRAKAVVISGSMRDLNDRVDELGIQVTRGDGLYFKESNNHIFPAFFHYEQFKAGKNSYLCLGLGNSLCFWYLNQNDLLYLTTLVLSSSSREKHEGRKKGWHRWWGLPYASSLFCARCHCPVRSRGNEAVTREQAGHSKVHCQGGRCHGGGQQQDDLHGHVHSGDGGIDQSEQSHRLTLHN